MATISVVIPTYNRASFVCDAVESTLVQSYDDHEIIVVDDGSTDDTKERMTAFGGKVRYLAQQNRGPSAARNAGILHAKGDYIAFCDSDDRFLPDKLEKQMCYLREHPTCKFLYTWYYNVNETGKITKLRKPLSCQSREQLQYYLFTRRFTIRTSTVLIQKECFNTVGLFNEKYWYSQDWDMWLRLAHAYHGHCLEEPLVEYRFHGDNRSSHHVRIYHPEIRQSTLELYGWDDDTLNKLEARYLNSANL